MCKQPARRPGHPDAASSSFGEKERLRLAALDAAGMLVKPTPNFSVTLGTDVPDISQEEIVRRRKERMERRDAVVQAKGRVLKKHK